MVDVLFTHAATILTMIYFVIGSYSLGYLFLRIGWPNTKKLGVDYLAGWSIIVGTIFAIITAVSAIAMRLLGLRIGSLAEQFFIQTTLIFAIAIGIMCAKQYIQTRNPEQEKSDNEKRKAKEMLKKAVQESKPEKKDIVERALEEKPKPEEEPEEEKIEEPREEDFAEKEEEPAPEEEPIEEEEKPEKEPEETSEDEESLKDLPYR